MDNPVSLSTTQLNPPSEEEDVKEESLSQLKNTSSGISSSSSVAALPIRAPLSFDSDVDNNQTPIKINGTNTSLKVANIGFVDSDSDIVLSSSDDEEEGFLSGEDEFGITSSDRNFLADPDEKTLDMLLGTQKIVPFVAPQPVFVASPSSSLIDDKVFVPPKALLSGDDDEDDEGFVSGLDEDDEGLSDVSNVVTSVKIPSVESSMIPKALVSGEDDVVPDIVDKVDSEVSSIAMVPSVIEKTKVAEENISPEEVVSSSVEMIVPVVTEAAPIESSVVITEDTLLKDTKSDEVDVSPPEEEVKESKDVFAVEKKIDVQELVTETKDSLEVRENGVSDVPAQESVGADSGDNQSGVEELVKSVFPVEVKDINASNPEDSNVETKQPILVELEKTVVEDEKVSEPKIVEILVDKDVSLGSQPEKAAVVVEELVEPKLVEDTAGAIADAPSGLESGMFELFFFFVTNFIVETSELYSDELKLMQERRRKMMMPKRLLKASMEALLSFQRNLSLSRKLVH